LPSCESAISTETFPWTTAAEIQVHVNNAEVKIELADVDAVTVVVQKGAVTSHFHNGRLVVTAPRRHHSGKGIRLLIKARPNSKLHLTGGKNQFSVTGSAHTLVGEWSSGDLVADAIENTCRIRAGSGRIRLGASNGHLNLRIGICDIEVRRITGTGGQLTSGGGTVQFGTVESDLSLTAGAGTISISDAAAGKLQVRTGPGTIRIGIRSGVLARLDLASRSGSARSELPVSETIQKVADAPRGQAPLQISATSMSGDIIVGHAA
jgi:hypothetical protein